MERGQHRSVRLVAVLATAGMLLAGCSSAQGAGVADSRSLPADGGSTPAPTSGSTSGTTGSVVPGRVTTVATGLTAPWGLAFLPGGDALVSERDAARIVRVTPAGRVTSVGVVPGVVPGGEGGLLGLAVSRDVATDHWLYAYLTAEDDNRVVRMRYEGGRLGQPQVLLEGIAKAGNHDGGRMVFGPDGMLYIGVGDAGQSELAQDRDSLNGKVLRIAPDGSVPADNPFGSPVWSYGHRNVQGLAFDDQGRLWASEFGQQTYDELNLIQKGRDYGWPVVEGPRSASADSRFVDPVADWSPTSTASPSGLAWVHDTVFLGALAGQRLLVVPVGGARAGQPTSALAGYGRLRTVAAAPDGSLWVTTSNTDGRADPQPGDDRILRVELKAAG